MKITYFSDVITEMINLLQYVYNKDLITYIKLLFKVKNIRGQ